MGKASPLAEDRASVVVTGAFTAVGVSESFQARGAGGFNYAQWGTASAKLVMERSFDGGDKWFPVTSLYRDDGVLIEFSEVVSEPESGVLYRVNCLSYTSGTANYRMSW